MKYSLLVLAAHLTSANFARAQEEIPELSRPASSPTTARIFGDIPDGTPPLPAPPKPEFKISDQDVLSTTTHRQGGRTITVRKIKPIALPPRPKPPVEFSAEEKQALSQQLSEYREEHPKSGLLILGATVFRAPDSPPRTLVTYWPEGGGTSISFWSSADFALISGISSFIDNAGNTHGMILAWGNTDLDSIAELQAGENFSYGVSTLPEFQQGKATFEIIGEAPAAEGLIPIQSLHDLYNQEYDRLAAAHAGREQARLAREAELKANPPKPKDIVLNYWRNERPAPAKEGGGQ